MMLLARAVAIGGTLACFILARRLARVLGGPAWASPVLIAAVTVGGLLWVIGSLPGVYAGLMAPLTWWLKPAVVALGALLWDARGELKARALPLTVSVAGGLAVGVGSAAGLARGLRFQPEIAAAFATRTVTTPFAVAIQQYTGGPVALAAAFAVLGGIVGTIVVPPLLKALRIDGDDAVGTAVGVSSHLVGTDWLVRRRPGAAPFAGAAMVLAGVLAALVLPLIWRWLG